MDTMSVRAKRGGHVGANPVDRGKPGSKFHLVGDGGGLPLAVAVTAANVNDTSTFQAVPDDVPAARTPAGRRRTRPGTGSTPTRASTTVRRTGPTCAAVGSGRGSPGAGSSRRPGWVGTAGGWSGRCRG
jgi:hypothetical protein